MGKTAAYNLTDVLGNAEYGVCNLLCVYSHSTASERRKGIAWYADAYHDAAKIARLYGLSVELVIKVAAVLSPQMNWDNNMPAAEAVIRYYVAGGYVPSHELWTGFGGELPLGPSKNHDLGVSSDAMFDHPCTAYRANQIKALWLLQGVDESIVIGGPKVAAFIDNILYYATSQNVTVDSHAIQAWFGKMDAGTYSVPDRAYDLIRADYVKAAEVVGITPLQFQAIVWLTKKRLQEEGPEPQA